MIFGQESAFARFLISADNQADKAFQIFKEHLEWRRSMNVNMLLDSEEIKEK